MTRIEARAAPEAHRRRLRDAGLSDLLARVYAARGIDDPADLDVSLARFPDPGTLAGMDAAVERLAEAYARRERICIVGDYDADGATSTAVAVLGLTALGFEPPAFVVPNRFEYGYGLTPPIVELAAARHAPDLLVTVDNGVASVEGVAAAAALGMDVVITDHHLPGAELPDAAAIVDPRLAPGSAFDDLAGVGVMFCVLVALRRALRARGVGTDAALAELLDLVALGTVADVVPLSRTNRILVEQGLRRIRRGRCRPGIAALAEVGRRERPYLVAGDLAFALAPRLNAAGRLADMERGIALLLADSFASARPIAEELDAMNSERRRIEADMQASALTIAEDLPDDWGMCLHDPGWHPGVVGLVAGRIRERCDRPVIAFAEAEPGLLRGSARSIPALHVRDAIERVATLRPGLVKAFGGHAAAAGLTIVQEDLGVFAQAFDAVVRELLDAEDLSRVLLTDGGLGNAELDLAHALALERAGPWGQGFPEPLFEGVYEVEDARVVGEAHVRLRLRTGSTKGIGAIAFGGVERGWDAPGGRVRLVHRLQVNRFRGSEQVQFGVVHLEDA